MKQYFILLPLVFMVALFSLNSKNAALENQSALTGPIPTPTPLAVIERLELDKTEALYPCSCGNFTPRIPDGCGLDENGEIKKDNLLITVKTVVLNPKNTPLVYEYAVTGGRISGQGNQIIWNLEGVRPGTYQITTAIKGKRGVSTETKTRSVKVVECNCQCPCVCPNMEIKGKETVRASESLVFAADITGGTAVEYTYNWTVSQGEIVSGQGTAQIKVKTTPEMTGYIKTTVQIKAIWLCEACPTEMTYTTLITK